MLKRVSAFKLWCLLQYCYCDIY